MFVEFTVENFRSFRDKHVFTMQAAALRSNDSGLEESNVFTKNNFRLLKSKAIYGQNASGKSNIISALSFFKDMVNKSVREEGMASKIWDNRFGLLSDWDDQPIRFELVFFDDDVLYRYGFAINDGKVEAEWLFGRPGKQEVKYFVRQYDEVDASDRYFLGGTQYSTLMKVGTNEIFRPDSLFLTGAALMSHELGHKLRQAVLSSITIINGLADKQKSQISMGALIAGTIKDKDAIRSLIAAADRSIKDLEMLPDQEDSNTLEKDQEGLPQGKNVMRLYSIRDQYNTEGDLTRQIPTDFGKWESEGTQKLFAIIPFVLQALLKGSLLVIDEFDARFHPALTKKIVDLFHTPSTNPHNAQLIFVTHDASLLSRSRLRRDQVCLVDKNQYGVSSFRSLINYKGVRKDASYEKEYLQGTYGAEPYLDEFDHIIASYVNTGDERG